MLTFNRLYLTFFLNAYIWQFVYILKCFYLAVYICRGRAGAFLPDFLSSFLPDFFFLFPLENVLLGAAGMFGKHHQGWRAPSLCSAINKYLLLGINPSSSPQRATLGAVCTQHLFYISISSQPCRDAWETFVWNFFYCEGGKLGTGLVWMAERAEMRLLKCNCWNAIAEMQLLSALSWCQQETAPCLPAGMLNSCTTQFFIKSPFSPLNLILCVHLTPLFTRISIYFIWEKLAGATLAAQTGWKAQLPALLDLGNQKRHNLPLSSLVLAVLSFLNLANRY